MSQLGLMFVAIGISNYNISIFHLFNHAMFKALLFMSAGSIIHSIVYESQDIRTFGSLTKWLPITYVCLVIASLSLMATPGLTGFYSKDILIESVYGVYNISGYIIYCFSIISATLTSIYSIRLLYYIFFNTPNSNKYTYYTVKEANNTMILPMVILAIASIIMGYIFKDLYIGLGSPFNSIFTHPNNLSIIDTEFSIPIYIKLLPLILTILSTITVLFIYEYLYKFFNPMIKLINIHSKKLPFITNIYIFMNNKFMLDQILNNIILRSMIYLGILFNQYIDKGLLYQLGPTGIYNTLNILSYKLISLSSNTIIPTAKSSNDLTGNLYTTGIRHYTTYLITVLSFIILAYLINSSYILILFILLLLI